jgi:hypothetical protein
MRYFELTDDLYNPEDRWFLKSINVVDENKISIWKFLSPAKVELPSTKDLTISIRTEGKPLDFTFADFGVMVVNEKVADLLNDEECQLIPVKIEGIKNGHSYFITILLNCVDCVDESRSNFEKWQPNDPIRPDKAGMYKSIYKLLVDDKKINDNNNIFRLGKYNVVTIINEKLKKQFEQNAVTGVQFRDVT